MKRLLALLLTGLMVCAMMPVMVSAEAITLRWWGGVPAEYGPGQVAERFNEEYKDKGIQVEYVRFVNDETGNMKLETTLLGGGEIDLYMTYSTANLIKRGEGTMALELSDLLAERGFDMLKEQGELSANFIFEDGKIYGVPTKFEGYFLLANVDMFEAAGIELPLDGWTYSQFREVCKTLTHGEGMDKVYGMYWSTRGEIFRPSMIAQTVLGNDYLYRNGGTETNLDNEAFVEFNQMVQDMMWVDGSTITHTDDVTQQLTPETAFLSGRSAMSIGVWTIRSIKDLEKYPHDFETAYLPVPTSDTLEAKYSISDMTVGDIMCISPDTAYLDAALEFLIWYTRGGMTEGTPYGRVPLNLSISGEEKLEAYMRNGEGILHADSVSQFLHIPDNLAVDTITTKLPEIKKCFNEALERIYTNQSDAATALGEAKLQADEFLK